MNSELRIFSTTVCNCRVDIKLQKLLCAARTSVVAMAEAEAEAVLLLFAVKGVAVFMASALEGAAAGAVHTVVVEDGEEHLVILSRGGHDGGGDDGGGGGDGGGGIL
eukprot:NODE_2110_length_1293_cov_32.784566_g1921_i0.p1 GENE.NODE_2110_length_1293_cov_32.784566_g1921_i0~~NODE_2110_length_1293_cov_32.784566_g1921_i0.p1  ORF type:complete len:107 (+),score=22.54 NODE_2110_length_1293_cov_32.784566_g1921_i0:345-665(+)